jgi:hypothetical protein
METSEVMKAVVFDGPFKISVQDRPVPQGENAAVNFVLGVNDYC